jgi:two-component system chemotaxis response regulator CheY
MTIAEATVLIVDDEPILQMTFAILLKRAGATVHVAADGVEALEVLAREQIDAILTDKQMPNMDGVTFLRALRDRGTLYPCMLFVNGVEPESPAEMATLGVVEIVNKPLHPVELIAAFERVLLPLQRKL